MLVAKFKIFTDFRHQALLLPAGALLLPGHAIRHVHIGRGSADIGDGAFGAVASGVCAWTTGCTLTKVIAQNKTVPQKRLDRFRSLVRASESTNGMGFSNF